MKRCLTAFLFVVLIAHASSANDRPAGLNGHWLSAGGNVDVEIGPCSPRAEALLCGVIARVLSNQSMSGAGQMAGGHNDVGLKVLIDFASTGAGAFQGRILNRETGKIYDCILKPSGKDELEVRPYVFILLFGKTQVWQRVP